MTVKRASQLYTYYSAMWAGLYTIWYSLVTIVTVSVRKNPRPFVDKIIRTWATKLLNPTKMNYRVHNPHNVTFNGERRYIIMCNHLSAYDIPLSFVAIDGSLRMVAKKELFNIPIMSAGMRAAEIIKLDRQNRKQAVKDLEVAKQKMQSGIVVWIAPEGTRSEDGQLLPFKKGGFLMAIDTEAVVVPVVIKNIDQVLPTKTMNLHLGVDVDFCIGKPVDAKEFKREQVGDLLNQVRQQMLDMLEN